MNLNDLSTALLTVSQSVYHYHALNKEVPYIVWAEDGAGDAVIADDHVTEQTIIGTVDYFTHQENDPNFDKIQQALNSIDISWRLNSVQYEDDTKIIHYEWAWELAAWHG